MTTEALSISPRATLYVDGAPLEYEQFLFPDGQPHITLSEAIIGQRVVVLTRLVHALDFINLLLIKEVLDVGGNTVDLVITYMSGARMDRRIDDRQPFTLGVYADLVKAAGFSSIAVMDPHSAVTTLLLGAGALYPVGVLSQVLPMPRFKDAVVVAPDAGSTNRVSFMLHESASRTGLYFPAVQGLKHRDPQTGKLSGFSVAGDVEGKRCLIIDDICDGGGTFVGLAEVLRSKGATEVDLFVTHGIFSKGKQLEGIDSIFTTDSFFAHSQGPNFAVFKLAEYGDLQMAAPRGELHAEA